MKLRARYDGRVLIPDEPLDLPADSTLDIEVTAVETSQQAKPVLERLAELARQLPPNPDAPRDGAAQHDHYLYGTPRRDNP